MQARDGFAVGVPRGALRRILRSGGSFSFVEHADGRRRGQGPVASERSRRDRSLDPFRSAQAVGVHRLHTPRYSRKGGSEAPLRWVLRSGRQGAVPDAELQDPCLLAQQMRPEVPRQLRVAHDPLEALSATLFSVVRVPVARLVELLQRAVCRAKRLSIAPINNT